MRLFDTSDYQEHRKRWTSAPGILKIAGLAAIGIGAYAAGARGIMSAIQKKALPYLEKRFGEEGASLAKPWFIEEAQTLIRSAERGAREHVERKFFEKEFAERYGSGEILSHLPEMHSLAGEKELGNYLGSTRIANRLSKAGIFPEPTRILEAFTHARAKMQSANLGEDTRKLEELLHQSYAKEFQQYALKGGDNLSLRGSTGLGGRIHRAGGLAPVTVEELLALTSENNNRNFHDVNLAGILKGHASHEKAFNAQLTETVKFFETQLGHAQANELFKTLPSGYLKREDTGELINLRAIQRYTHHAITTPLKSVKVPLVPFIMEMPPFRLFPFMASEGFTAAHLKAGEWSPEISRLLGKPAHQALEDDIFVYGRRAFKVFEGGIEALKDTSGNEVNFSLRFSKSGFYKDMLRTRSAEGSDKSVFGVLRQGLDEMLESNDPRKFLHIHRQTDPSKWNKVDNWLQQFKGTSGEIDELSQLHPRQLVKLLGHADTSEELQIRTRRLLFEQASSDPLQSLKLFKSLSSSMGEDPFLNKLVKAEHKSSYTEAFQQLLDKPGQRSVENYLSVVKKIEESTKRNPIPTSFESTSSRFTESVNKLISQGASFYSPGDLEATSFGQEASHRILGTPGLKKGTQDFYSGLLHEWFARQTKDLVPSLKGGRILAEEGADLFGFSLEQMASLKETIRNPDAVPTAAFRQANRLGELANHFATWNYALSEKPDLLETILSKIVDPAHREEIARRVIAPEVNELSGIASMLGMPDPFVSTTALGRNLRKPLEEKYVAPYLADRFNWKGSWAPTAEKDLFTHSDYYPIVESKNLFETIKSFDVNSPMKSMKDYLGQYRSAFDPTAPMSELATPAYFFVDRLNRYIADFGLGLPEKLRSTPLGGVAGFIGLRVAPAMLGIEAWKYLNYQSKHLFGKSPDELRADVQAHSQLGTAKLLDTLHITPLLKRIVDLSSGLERYVTPRSADELDEFLKHGSAPVRKGRFWTIGTRSEFTGAGVEWYSPSWYQIAKSRWQEASNVDLDSKAYWQHSWLPNITNPVAPLWRLIDRDWWANKHQKDRPYPFAGTSFDTETAWGPFLNPIANRVTGGGEPLRGISADSLQETGRLGHLPNKPTVMAEGGQGENFSVLRTTGGGMMRLMGLPSGPGFLGGLLGGRGGGSGGGGGAGGGIGGGGGYGSGTNVAGSIRGGGGGQPGTISSSLVSQFAREPNDNLADTSLSYSKDFTGRANIRVAGAETPGQDLQELGRSARGAMGVYGFFVEHGFPLDRHDPFTVQNPTTATGWSRRYWMREYGGIGGGLTEWGRRFFHAPENDPEAWNPLKNDQPEWMPENLRHGDPYMRVRGIGELRLPGDAYERTHQVKMMEMRASAMGKSEEELVSDFFHEGAYASHESKAMKEGTRMHKVIQRRLHKAGITLGTEVPVWDEKRQISGHIDAILRTANGPEIIDIKTMNAEKYHSGKVFQENVDQLTAYAGLTGIHNIGLIYVNRDDPKETRHEKLNYSPILYHSLMSKVDHARKIAWGLVNSGKKSRGDLYDLVSRFEILADTAPNSPEFKAVAIAIAGQSDQLTEEEKARVTSARERSRMLRKQFDLHDYRFSNQDQLVKTHAVVKKVIDMNTLLIAGMGPVRLAGVSMNAESLDKLGIEPKPGESDSAAFYRHYGIGPGSVVPLKYSPAEKKAYKDAQRQDTRGESLTDKLIGGRRDSMASFLGTPAPKVIIGNLNRRFLKSGLGTERAEDKSPAAIDVRYGWLEKQYGKTWEKLAHLDSPFHTKFLRVRSPLEQHIRGEVYGSDESSWSDMMGSYVKPTMEAMASRNPIFAAMTGAFVGSLFHDTREGKMAFAGGGAILGAALSGIRYAFRDKNWIPARVKKRWELDEYYDALKYVKWSGIAKAASEKAKTQEHVDPEALMARHFALAEWKKDQKRGFSQVLRDLAETKGTSTDQLTNQEIAQVRKARRSRDKMDEPSYEVLGPWATMAMQATREYQRTLTGLPEHANLSQVLSALPKKHRELAAALIEHGSSQEKEKFFHLIPELEKSALGPYLGINRGEIPPKPKLVDYFKDHFLPGQEWKGWRPEVNLGDIKTRAEDYSGVSIQHPSEARIKKAEVMSYGAGVPISQHPTLGDLHGKLNDLLYGKGMENLNIHISSTPAKRAALTINMDFNYDDHDKVVDEIQNRI